mgnify:CR=1 FL=1
MLCAVVACVPGPAPFSDVAQPDAATVDAAAPDAPAPDATPDVPGVDVAAPDAGPDAAPDARADASPPDVGADASSGFPDLASMYTGESFQALYRAVCARPGECDVRDRATVMGPMGCSVTAGRLSFSLRVCTPSPGSVCDTITGLVNTDGSSASVTVGVATVTRVSLERGPRYFVGATPRQSFHAQFATAPAVSPLADGVTGVPARTVAPDMGDVWMLGCRTD